MVSDFVHMVVDGLLGGGLLISLYTAKETKRQLKATNTETILQTNEKYIVKPLKEEITELRNNVRALTLAIQKMKDCEYLKDCPVRKELEKQGE